MRTAFDRRVEPVTRHGVRKWKERAVVFVACAARMHRDEFERLVLTRRFRILPIMKRANLWTSLSNCSDFNGVKQTKLKENSI